MELATDLLKKSRIEQAENNYTHWNGYRVYLGDGTYIQMQDTKRLREAYWEGTESEGYPQGLLEVIIERRSIV
jgi:hypothetical protein